MRLGFTELPAFQRWRDKNLSFDEFCELQNELMESPKKGAPIAGCASYRKLRRPQPGRSKGKRGGHRIIYMHVPEVERVILVLGYSKDLQEDLSPDEAKQLEALAKRLKAEEIAAAGGKRK